MVAREMMSSTTGELSTLSKEWAVSETRPFSLAYRLIKSRMSE